MPLQRGRPLGAMCPSEICGWKSDDVCTETRERLGGGKPCESVVRNIPGLPVGLLWACVKLRTASAVGAQEARGPPETGIPWGLRKGRV